MKLFAGQLDVNGGKLAVFGEAPMDNLKVLENIVYTYPGLQYEKHLRLRHILGNYALLFPDFDLVFAGRRVQLY